MSTDTSSTAARLASASRKNASSAMSPNRLVTTRRLWIGYMAIGLAAVGAVVPAAFAQAPRALGHSKPAGTKVEAEKQRPGSDTGISAAAPIGRASAGPGFADVEPIYVRRTTVRPGMTIVEISTTPFVPVTPG